MRRMGSYLFQAVAYGLFCWVIYYFSTSPAYHYLKKGDAELRLAFKHTAALREPCRKRTPEELQNLPPNMRTPMLCSRERSPVIVELEMDGKVLARSTFPPPGLHDDGSAFVYAKFPVPSGNHLLTVRMDDSVATPGFEFQVSQQQELQAGQLLVIGFDDTAQTFTFH
ncbi:MAG: hypothetical protein HQL64_01395 [Magnetococcales bacterium]|nr:hypothetical protein [Magnetococcales bacterium]